MHFDASSMVERRNWNSLLWKEPVAEYLPKPWVTLTLLMTYPSCPTRLSTHASYSLRYTAIWAWSECKESNSHGKECERPISHYAWQHTSPSGSRLPVSWELDRFIMKVRRARAWKVLHSMTKMWKSLLSNQLKRRLIVATVESVLLYGTETWILTRQEEKALDEVYTRMIRMALNVSWKDHVENFDLYDNLPRLSDKIRQRWRDSLGIMYSTRNSLQVSSSSGNLSW